MVVIAPHGGMIERYTDCQAERVAVESTRRGHPDNRCRSFATDFCDRVAQIDPDFFGREFADPMSTRCSLVCQHRQSSVLAGSVCFLPGR